MAIGARCVFPARPIGGIQRIVEITDNEQIEVSVPIIIKEACAAAPRRITDTGVRGDVGECPIAIVPVKDILSEIGNVEFCITIVVVIGACNALSVIAPVAHACGGGDVCKRPIAIVLVECSVLLRCGG